MSSSDGGEAVIVLTTVSSEKDAVSIARALVDERLAACVNVLPEMTSVFRWEGAVQEDPERQLIIKTTRRSLDAVRVRLDALHPYEVPEFLVLPVTGGSDRYLHWLAQSTEP